MRTVKPRTPLYRGQPTQPEKIPHDSRVYCVRFVDILGREFFKIGTSSYNLLARFQRDLTRYALEIIAISDWLTREEAFSLEKGLHTAFQHWRYRPFIPLVSGNTECYHFPTNTLSQICSIIGECSSMGRATGLHPADLGSIPSVSTRIYSASKKRKGSRSKLIRERVKQDQVLRNKELEFMRSGRAAVAQRQSASLPTRMSAVQLRSAAPAITSEPAKHSGSWF